MPRSSRTSGLRVREQRPRLLRTYSASAAAWSLLGVVCFVVLSAGSACQTPPSVNAQGGNEGIDAPSGSPDFGTLPVKPDGGGSFLPTNDGGCGSPTSCMPAGGRYCGIIGDGCGGNLNCGACESGQACTGNICTGGDGYDGGVLTSCTVTGGQYCGDIGNGIGGKLSCGPCLTPGWTCTSGICTADPIICPPKVCKNGDSQYCGTIGDGCGHPLDCGSCPAGLACVSNQCVPANCDTLTCNPAGGQYCGGLLGDGCGGSMVCGDCATPGWTCSNNVCKGGPDCKPTATCGAGFGKYCGTIGDGCGGSLACGDCNAGEVCKNNVCVPEPCSKLTCTPTGGQYCGGEVGDGCGGALDCSAPCPAGWTCSNHLCVGDATCKRLTSCSNGTAFNYCGDVGDNCGGVLHCGDDCGPGQVCDAKTGLCKGDATCVPKACTNGTIFNYCGSIGDGCGGTLACGNDCAKGQVCDSTTGLCKGGPDCLPVTCENGTPFNYCGDAGDGCGGSLHCGNDCAANQVCGTDSVCKGDINCKPITCDNGTGFNYCGTIGDGCGGSLPCPTKCGVGQECGAEGVCKGDATCVPKTCSNATPFNYCGTVGDGCGGKLNCGTNTCGARKVCDTSKGLCKGDDTCRPLTACTNGTDYNYCGTIGDGCGGSLACGTDCGAGKVCDASKGLCQGGTDCVRLASCANGTDFNYCGTIGDGCGGSIDCGTTNCGAGKECDTKTGLCKGDVSCTPITSCMNGTAYNYCGKIGDGCGGSIDCGTDTCGEGKVCDTSKGLCKTDNCAPASSCANGTAFNYCGKIGDGCGGSIDCGTTNCGTGKECNTAKGMCKGDSNCHPATSCTNGTPFNYCGKIGDGCGGSIDCGTSTCGTGKECDTAKGVCRGDTSCHPITSCTNGTAYDYCGKIGDGCGGSLNCPTTCAAGQACNATTGLCKAQNCQPRTDCANGTDYRYCGTIGDGCGGSIDCGTNTCGTGKECDTTHRVCKGDGTCSKLSCTNSQGAVQYCGGEIGDGCGGSMSCTGTCPVKTKCQDHVCVCDDGLRCQIATCASGSTTIKGKVYDPAGANPLFNVMVFVPNTPMLENQALPEISHGLPSGQSSCDRCPEDQAAWSAKYGDPVAAAITGTDGTFELTNAPSGSNIPLVFQIGKWRRQVTIPTVTACAVNDVSAGDTATSKFARLPKSTSSSKETGTELSLPKIALAAGAYDRLQCLLMRMGVDTSEFTMPAPSGTGSVSMYLQSRNEGRCATLNGSTKFPDATGQLWGNQSHLDLYDMVLLNCGGNMAYTDPTQHNLNTDFIRHPADVDRMKSYVERGGRVFAEHYHWGWIRSYTGYPSAFTDVATWTPQSQDTIGNQPRDTLIDRTFDRGRFFADWLYNVVPGSTLGHITLTSGAKPTAVDDVDGKSQRWIYEPNSPGSPTGAAKYTHYLSFDAPVGAEASALCGRFVYTGLHVTDTASDPGDNVHSTTPTSFPACCTTGSLTPQEKALEFMIFDLSSCINGTGGGTPVVPPPAPPAPPPPAPPPPAPAPPGAPAAPPPPAPAPPPPPPPAPPAPPPAPPPPAAPPPPPPASPPPATAPSPPPPPPAPAPPAPPPPATTPPSPPAPPVPPPPPPPPPVAAPPPPPPPPPAQTPPPPPPPPPAPDPYIP